MHLGGNRRWVPLKSVLIPVCLFFFFPAGLLKLDFNDTLVSTTHTFQVNIFNLESFRCPGRAWFLLLSIWKMFTGSVCVLLTSVSLKLIKIKIQLIYTTTSSWEKKNGGWRVSDADWFYFSFYDPQWFFYDPSWSESNFILFFHFLYLIRVNPSWSGPTFLPA